MDRRSYSSLRVLIVGQHNSFDHVLAANIRCWGHEVIMLPLTAAMASGGEVEGDVLLYDLDESFRVSTLMDGKDEPILPISLAADRMHGMIGNCAEQWPRVRLTIALSSRSVSRTTLEYIGAVACLQKPFEMGRLQQYLRVLQGLLCEQAELQQRSKQVRILVVDDDVTIANTIREYILFESNYEVKVAYDGLEALEQCLDWQPHCIVTDLIMPWMNGYQVIQCLAASSQQTVPAFVIISALTQLEVPPTCSYLQGKVAMYVNKPFNMHQLLSAIDQVCME